MVLCHSNPNKDRCVEHIAVILDGPSATFKIFIFIIITSCLIKYGRLITVLSFSIERAVIQSTGHHMRRIHLKVIKTKERLK